MKIHNYVSRKVLILVSTGLLFVSINTVSQALSSDAHSRRFARTRSAYKQPVGEPARLIIRRVPDLGNNVIVALSIDGVGIEGLGYGRAFKGFLRPGRHILSVLPTPAPKWTIPWEMVLDVRRGETYRLTATGDHSGYLILVPVYGLYDRE
jgi:hypothetical protein